MLRSLNILLLAIICFVLLIFTCCSENPIKRNDYTIDKWNKTKLDSVHVTALAINRNGDLFVGTVDAPSPIKIFRSKDNGDDWKLLETCDINGYVNVISINHNGDIYAASNNGMCSDLIYSTDNGDSWNNTNIHPGLTIRSIVFNSLGHVYICSVRHDESMGGVFYTTDQDTAWIQTNWSIYEIAISLLITSEDHLIVATNNKIFKSIDNGDTWNEIFNSEQWIGFHSLKKKSDEVIIASTHSNGIYFSTDCGHSWTQSSLNNISYAPISIDSVGNVYTADNWHDGKGIFYSKVSLNDWYEITYNLEDEPIQSIAISPLEYIFVGTWGKGILKMELSNLNNIP